jgi:hypothetical protein
VACAAIRREGAVARGLRRRPTGGRGRSLQCVYLRTLVALLPCFHYNHIYISAFILSVHGSGPSWDGP